MKVLKNYIKFFLEGNLVMENSLLIEKVPDKVSIVFNGSRFKASKILSIKINNHWESLVKKGKKFTRGNVYTIKKIRKNSKELNIELTLTDYAHFLYSIYSSNLKAISKCRVVSTSALIETRDKYFIFGEMNKNTFMPGRIQCSGGGLDENDLENGSINFVKNIKKEVYEELGLNISDSKIVKKKYVKYIGCGGKNNFIIIIFKIDLSIDSHRVKKIFKDYTDKLKSDNIEPEFKKLFIAKKDFKIIEKIQSDKRDKADYVIPLIREDVFLS